MVGLRPTINDLRRLRSRWRDLIAAAGEAETAAPPGPGDGGLTSVARFGSNPGDLRMLTYVPEQLPRSPALVVVLHGCTQNAAGYDLGSGWSTLADRYGFVLVFPEQKRANNQKTCFNWFLPGDIRRERGEALSIRQMVDRAVADHGVDRRRVFVTGLSAGGAMTAVMLATYPDVFAGGGVIAGLPYGIAHNVQQALQAMFQPEARPARALGDLVRAASLHSGPWPRLSIWHGDADATVRPDNAVELVKQWTDVHGIPQEPSARGLVDGHLREVWCDRGGREVVESYTVARMGHGAPLHVGDEDHMCGAAGRFLFDVGISSSYHMARFWGLVPEMAARQPRRPARPSRELAAVGPAASSALEGEILPPGAAGPESFGSRGAGYPLDVGKVIGGALRAAGLIKS